MQRTTFGSSLAYGAFSIGFGHLESYDAPNSPPVQDAAISPRVLEGAARTVTGQRLPAGTQPNGSLPVFSRLAV